MKNISASMAGTLLNVLVSEGDSVKIGDQVATLESMKMEIPIESTEEGTVTKIHVEVGAFINEEDPLISLN